MKTVAVIFGGRSAEHDISIVTAISSIIKPLELTKEYKVEAVYISKDGAWYCDDKLKDISLYTSGKIANFTAKNLPVSVNFSDGLTIIKHGGFKAVKTKVDVVFPAMHGTFGEDGSLMGILEMANVPYVGCPIGASVVAMDKVLSKQIAEANNIPVSKFLSIKKSIFEKSPQQEISKIEKNLKYPLFIKPAHLGSSIGISKAVNSQELLNGLEVATHYDDKVIVEEEVPNLVEVTLPVMGNNDLTPAMLERPLTEAEDFFDFDTKYLQGGKKGGGKKGGKGTQGAQGYSEVPAKLDSQLYERAEQTGLAVYRALDCAGTARVDMLIDEKAGIVYFNEVNPLPGSLYAHNWRISGVSSVDLVQKLVELALQRHDDRQKNTTSFDTNFLQQF